jgi:hypothetical protein
LEDHAATYCLEFHSPPTQPHVRVFNVSSQHVKALSAKPFAYTLVPEDLSRLAADPAKRAHWIELCTHLLLPPLRELLVLIRTKVRAI